MRFTTILITAAFSFTFSSAVYAIELPAPVEQAVTSAKPFEELAVSFSLRASTPSDLPIVLRFEAETATWSVIEGDTSKLDEETLEELEEIKAEVSKPGELTYADTLDEIAIIGLKEENADRLIYQIDLDDDEDPMPKPMKEAVNATLHISKNNGQITLFSMRSAKAFKPAMVAKIDTLIIEQEFTDFPALGIGLLSRYYNKVSGEAMFQKFDEEFTLEFFDYTLPAD